MHLARSCFCQAGPGDVTSEAGRLRGHRCPSPGFEISAFSAFRLQMSSRRPRLDQVSKSGHVFVECGGGLGSTDLLESARDSLLHRTTSIPWIQRLTPNVSDFEQFPSTYHERTKHCSMLMLHMQLPDNTEHQFQCRVQTRRRPLKPPH